MENIPKENLGPKENPDIYQFQNENITDGGNNTLGDTENGGHVPPHAPLKLPCAAYVWWKNNTRTFQKGNLRPIWGGFVSHTKESGFYPVGN